MQVLTIRISKELHRKLKTEAFEKEITMNDIIKEMLQDRYSQEGVER